MAGRPRQSTLSWQLQQRQEEEERGGRKEGRKIDAAAACCAKQNRLLAATAKAGLPACLLGMPFVSTMVYNVKVYACVSL
jgi:hypothetical protein